MDIKKEALKYIDEIEDIEVLEQLERDDDFISDVRTLSEKDRDEIISAIYVKRCDILGLPPF